MTGAPLPGQQRRIAAREALDDLDALLKQLRQALPNVNSIDLRPRIERLGGFIADADLVLVRRAEPMDQAMVDRLAGLRGDLGLVRLPMRDPDFGFTHGLSEVNGAQGQIVLALDRALDAGKAQGIVPTAVRDTGIEVPRHLIDHLSTLVGRLNRVEKGLGELETALHTAKTGPVAQKGLVNFYLREMKVELRLALLSLTIGDTAIDFASLTRAIEAMARLTGDFVATLIGWAQRAWAAIRDAGARLVRPVRRVVDGVRTAVRWASHKLARAQRHEPDPRAQAANPPPDFSMEAVKALILAGKHVPSAWVPFVTELDLSQSGLTDATPLAGLTALQSLDLWNTNVSDATPLAGLTALQSLHLGNTNVSDATPLAGLTALQTLNLGGTQVSDATPLVGLTALQTLDLWGTQVRDTTPLAELTALESLNLWGTQVSDAAPLAGLTALQTLDLSRTQVSDATPLAGLTALQSLDLDGTQVSDATPLAGLIALEKLDITGTRITDVSALRQPKLEIVGRPGG